MLCPLDELSSSSGAYSGDECLFPTVASLLFLYSDNDDRKLSKPRELLPLLVTIVGGGDFGILPLLMALLGCRVSRFECQDD